MRPVCSGAERVRKHSHSLENCLVDAPAPEVLDEATTSNPGYRNVERSRLVSSPDISAMFGKPPDWFARPRNRRPLKERGFPNAIIRGRWLKAAVDAWFEREGTRKFRDSIPNAPGRFPRLMGK